MLSMRYITSGDGVVLLSMAVAYVVIIVVTIRAWRGERDDG